MLPSDSRHPRAGRRAVRRTYLAAPERLESRDLLATSPLGFSLPNLTITGSTGTRAAWGGQLGVIATVINQGTSTIPNPIAQAPGDLTTADAPATSVAVVITPRRSMAHAVTIGTFDAPPVTQNNIEQIAQTFTLPARPRGFPTPGHRFYVHLIINADSTVLEGNRGDNVSAPIPVKVSPTPRPAVRATALFTQSPLEPGYTIVPTISVTNFGTAPTSGPLEVALVASTTPNFTVGSSVVALYDITASIPAASQVPPSGVVAAFSQTATVLNNTYTFTGPAVTLPVSPAKYYLGVVVDPYGKVSPLSTPRNALSQVMVVGPNKSGLPPAGVISTGNSYPFPLPASGTLIGIVPQSSTTSSGTASTQFRSLF